MNLNTKSGNSAKPDSTSEFYILPSFFPIYVCMFFLYIYKYVSTMHICVCMCACLPAMQLFTRSLWHATISRMSAFSFCRCCNCSYRYSVVIMLHANNNKHDYSCKRCEAFMLLITIMQAPMSCGSCHIPLFYFA